MEGTLKKENLWLLNVLRGISALLIVLYHYTVQYEKSIGHLVPYTVTIPWGCYAVNTFFMLSGFLTVYTCAGRGRHSAVSFLKRRFLRLYPMFWVSMTVTTVYMLALMPERARSVRDFILNLTMIPSFFGAEAVDGVYWTLAKELMFYFGFSVVILRGSVQKNTIWLWSWLGLEIVCLVYTGSQHHLPLSGAISAILIPDQLYAFLAGCAVFYLNQAENRKEKGIILSYMLICVCLCFWLRSWEVAVFFVLSLWLLVICSQGETNKKMENAKWVFQPALFLSEISYVLYLTHQFIGFGLIRKIEAMGMVGELWLMLPIVHSVALAAVLHYGLEIRINRRLGKA